MKYTTLTSLYALALADMASLEQYLRIGALLAPVIVAIVHCLRRPPRREPKRSRSKLPMIPAIALATVALFLFGGCSTTNVSELVHALGADTNAVSVSVRSPWGTVEVHRNGSQ